jgi:hypothetical protein
LRDCPKEARLSKMAKESSSNFFIIIFLWQEIQLKYLEITRAGSVK